MQRFFALLAERSREVPDCICLFPQELTLSPWAKSVYGWALLGYVYSSYQTYWLVLISFPRVSSQFDNQLRLSNALLWVQVFLTFMVTRYVLIGCVLPLPTTVCRSLGKKCRFPLKVVEKRPINSSGTASSSQTEKLIIRKGAQHGTRSKYKRFINCFAETFDGIT